MYGAHSALEPLACRPLSASQEHPAAKGKNGKPVGNTGKVIDSKAVFPDELQAILSA